MSYKNEILKLREKGINYNDISKQLGCSKGTVSFHCRNNGLGGSNQGLSFEEIKEMDDYYQEHTAKETANKFSVTENTVKFYCRKKKYNKLSLEEKKRRRVGYVQKRRRKVKEMSVEYKGGECEKCGYDKCIDAMEFHHLDEDNKDFGVSDKGYTRSWEKVKEELDKCMMVCANCHRELHAGLITI